ncbi:MAG: ABC transporter permease, partial [Bacteroidota bacterium]
MLFRNRKREARLLEAMKKERPSQGYWRRVWTEYKKNRMALWALRILLFLIFIALTADFLANDKPIYCKLDGQTHWPIFKNFAVQSGWSKWPDGLATFDWQKAEYESVVWPLIPYADNNVDISNYLKGPFEEQSVQSPRFRHRLGTDGVGRDVAAGMIKGTRVAIFVGVLAMLIAAFIGIFFGAIAGYFGDKGLRLSRARLLLNAIGLVLAYFYAIVARRYQLSSGEGLYTELLISLLIALGILLFVNLLSRPLEKIPFLGHRHAIAVDLLVMRFVEVMNSIPGLLLLLAILVLVPKPTIFVVMVIIGMISWTGITRFIRAEILRVRNLEYIEAARAMGYKDRRIIWRHAIPNALGPVLITIAFGIAGAILLEAFLSFLGQGVGIENLTWGRMLSLARSNFSAWWLAVFPGFAIFLTVS